METFSIRDLRERVGELTQQLETGHLSIITKHGQPLAVTVPVDEVLLKNGATFALATKLYDQGDVSLGYAAKMCGMAYVDFMQAMGAQGIAVIRYEPGELEAELETVRALFKKNQDGHPVAG